MPVRLSYTDERERARGAAAGRGRRFAAWLAVGWAAFWLNTTVLACCADLIPKSQSSGETVFQGLPGGNPNYPDHDDPLLANCLELTAPTVTVAYAAAGSSDRTGGSIAAVASSMQSSLVPATPFRSTLRFPSLHPPHLALYLRTARLLI